MLDKLLGDRKYFKILFIIYLFTNTLALGYFGIQFNPLCLIVFGYAFLIMIYSLIKGELVYSKNHLLVIGLYGVLLFIATYLNKDYSSHNSLVIAGMQLIIFILIFAQPKSMTLKKMKQELQMIIPLTCVLVGIASFLSLGMYFFNISGARYGWYIGLVGSRLFGVYFNCNPASFLAIIVILLSLIAIKNHYKGRFLYFINIFVQLGYIILTQCRAAIIILAIVVTAVLYYHFFRAKEMSRMKKVFLNLAMCTCILFGTAIVNEVAFIIPELQGATEEDGGRFQLSKVHDIITLTMSGELQNIPKIIHLVDDVSSGRITLAKDSIHVWQKSPIQGIGAGNFRTMLVDVTGTDNWGQQLLHSHNVFLESLVTAGVFGFLLFIIFFIKTLFTTRDIFMKYKNKKSYYIVLLFIMIYVSEFIGGMFDFGVFYVYSLSATLAWLFLGYIYWLNDQPDMSLVENTNVAVFNKYSLISIQYKKEDIDDLKPEFVVLNTGYVNDDYIMRVQYILGNSKFVYDVYYTLHDKIRNQDVIDKELAREFYSLINDEMNTIYEQSRIQ